MGQRRRRRALRPGVPIGEVSRVFEDLRAGTYRAVLEPYVHFTALDQVGVVVRSGGDGVIEPGSSKRAPSGWPPLS